MDSPETNSALSVKNITKKFGDFTAVDHVSFEVDHGSIFGFLGPNGAGKSTTINMLSTILAPSSGEALVAGFDIYKQRDEVRKSIGIIFQEPSLDVDLTAWENLKLHAALYGVPKGTFERRAHELLQLVQLEDRKDGIVKTFSGGMKRRLEIARGLLHHPKVLFLDEPTIGLDPQTRASIWKYLKDLRDREHITLFLTTHYLPETEQCDKVAIMNNGKIISFGSPAELKKQYGKESMDEVFIEATGHGIMDEDLTKEAQARVRFKQGGGWRR